MIREATLKDFVAVLKQEMEGFSYKGTNGYTGILVPWRVGLNERQVALYIFGPDGKLVLHTGNTPARTMDDLKEQVELIEYFLDMFGNIDEEVDDDEP